MESRPHHLKRQKFPHAPAPGLPPGLWVVATPIGNLSDLTERARVALQQARWIACEDTRRTRALLSALQISASIEGQGDRLRRFDRHASPEVAQEWIRELVHSGASMAVVSDAGTPSISDPGAQLVRAAVEAGVQVTPVPGPSAVVALLSACGWPEADSFCFQGFIPRSQDVVGNSIDRFRKWAESSGRAWVSVWFESPERIEESLQTIRESLSGAPRVDLVVCKELTKVHEKFFRGDPDQVLLQVREELQCEGKLGEWSLAIRFPALDATRGNAASESAWLPALECLVDAGVKASECARILSHRFGVSRDEAYSRATNFKKNQRGG